MSVRFVNRLPRWHGKRFVSVHVRSIDELSEVEKILKNPSWVFRGHAKSSWKLWSSLDRMVKSNPINAGMENRAINDFKQKAKEILCTICDIDTLANMQHYGTPTRLLDFTWLWNVALWFAFNESVKTKFRAVWAINLKSAIENSSPLSVDINSEAAEIASRDKLAYDEFHAITEFLKEEAFWNQPEFSKRVKTLADKIIHNPTLFSVGILPIIWANDDCNPRMKAQGGLFIMPLTFSKFDENLFRTFGWAASLKAGYPLSIKDFRTAYRQSSYGIDCVKIVICNTLRDEIMTKLNKDGLSADKIYPDLVGIAQSVKYV